MAFNQGKCMSRVWGDGLGGQCSRWQCTGSDYCTSHHKEATDKTRMFLPGCFGKPIKGRIDEPVPIYHLSLDEEKTREYSDRYGLREHKWLPGVI
jgi:hypothetical protein